MSTDRQIPMHPSPEGLGQTAEVFHPLCVDTRTIDPGKIVTVDGTPVLVTDTEIPEVVTPGKVLGLVEQLKETCGDITASEVFTSVVPLVSLLRRLDQVTSALRNRPDLVGHNQVLIQTEFETVIDPNLRIPSDEAEVRRLLGERSLELIGLRHPNPLIDTDAAYVLCRITPRSETQEGAEATNLREALSTFPAGETPYTTNADGNQEGTILRTAGGKFSEDDINELINLFKVRFGGIGENFPYRLDVDEEATRELLNDPRNIFVVHRGKDGKATSCIFITDDMDACPWINERFLKQASDSTSDAEPYLIFAPGVAAYENAPMGIGQRLITEAMRIILATNQPNLNIWLEATDVSRRYIPTMSERALAALVQTATRDQVKVIATKQYVLIPVSLGPTPD